MAIMTPVPKNDPMMKDWERFNANPDYENTKRWATVADHTEGALWTAFIAGWQIAMQRAETMANLESQPPKLDIEQR